MSTDVPALLRRPGCRGLALAGLYLVLSFFWRAAVEIGVSVLLFGVVAAREGATGVLADPTLLQEALTAPVLAVVTMVQLSGLLVIAALLARTVRWTQSDAFSLARSPLLILGVALVGGATVGFFPGWVARTISENFPALDLGNLEMIGQTLATAGPVGIALLLLAICVFAPVIEELVFRGFLWRALEKGLPTWVVWLGTSALFALYHVDPVHVIAVFFTGLFLGWLRWISGSVWPAILAHFVNNTLAAVFALTLSDQPELASPPGLVLGALAVTVALAGIGWFARVPPRPAPTGDNP